MLKARWLLLLVVWAALPACAEVLRLGTFGRVADLMAEQVAVLRRAAQTLGYEIELTALPAQRSLAMAASGELDGELLRQPYAVERYPTLWPVMVPLYRLELWVMMSEDRTCPASEREVRFMKPVGVLGLKYSDQVYRLSEVGFEQAINTPAALRMLQAKRADYIALPQTKRLRAMVGQSGLKLKPCLSRPLLSLDSFVYLHEKHRALIAPLERELAALFGVDRPGALELKQERGTGDSAGY